MGELTRQGPWHIADPANQASILQVGLLAQLPESDGADLGVYVWHHMPLDQAVERFSVQYGTPGGQYDVWAVRDMGEPTHDSAWGGGSGFYPHNVPPHRIAFVQTFTIPPPTT